VGQFSISANMSSDQTPLPEGDQLNGAQAEKDFVFEIEHPQGLTKIRIRYCPSSKRL